MPSSPSVAYERLGELLRVLRAADPTRLNMDYWWSECKTDGCAAGHAAHDPYFNALGLNVDSLKRSDGALELLERLCGITDNESMYLFGLGYTSSERHDVTAVIARIETVRARYAPTAPLVPTAATTERNTTKETTDAARWKAREPIYASAVALVRRLCAMGSVAPERPMTPVPLPPAAAIHEARPLKTVRVRVAAPPVTVPGVVAPREGEGAR